MQNLLPKLALAYLVLWQIHMHTHNSCLKHHIRTTGTAFQSVLDHSDNTHETALVLRTVAPLHPLVLDKIYEFACRVKDSPYDFWLLVDETRNNQTERILDMYFRKRGGSACGETKKTALKPPSVFSVSESIVLQRYPRLTSYIHNYPERNFHNDSGVCCGRRLMWQMFLPTFAIFMQEKTMYRYAWSFEDDISAHGQHSMYDVIRMLDLELGADPVDLAAFRHPKDVAWGGRIHTMGMEAILEEMKNASVGRRLYSDALQRHSSKLSYSIYREVHDNNVMQFGEAFVWPIAWKHKHTVVDLVSLVGQQRKEKSKTDLGSIFVSEKITGGKFNKADGVIGLLNTPNHNIPSNIPSNCYDSSSSTTSEENISGASTFIFHEEILSKHLRVALNGSSAITVNMKY